MSELLQLITLCLAGGMASLLGAVIITKLKNSAEKWSNKLTSFAAGVLLSVGILDLLPESIEMGLSADKSAWMMMVGILLIFILEKSGLWFHHHDGTHGHSPSPIGVFLGDVFHNFIDGMAIGSAFLVDPPVGLVTTLAVAGHELPKEMSDFWIYTKSGMSNLKAIGLNLISSLVAVFGGLSVYGLSLERKIDQGSVLAIASGMFVFVALSDLVPEIHEEIEKSKGKSKFVWIVIFVLGLLVGAIGHMLEV